MVEPSKRDWKLYREKIGGWQEHYMEKLVKEYADYLCSDLPASTKFWEIDKRFRRDKVISMDDLEEFSDDLKEAVALILRR